jgi:hypothetical protein
MPVDINFYLAISCNKELCEIECICAFVVKNKKYDRIIQAHFTSGF